MGNFAPSYTSHIWRILSQVIGYERLSLLYTTKIVPISLVSVTIPNCAVL